jgi:hypothetical protein
MKPLETQHWQEEGKNAFEAIAQWRMAHPHATKAEIEQAIDEHLYRLRAHLIEDTAQASAASKASGPPRCEQCGRVLQARGKRTRTFRTHGDQPGGVGTHVPVLPALRGRFFSPWIRNLLCPMGSWCRMRSRPWCV